MAEYHACLGLSFLGECLYNPALPNGIYLSIGNAISALGFILAIQQLLKPIYQFRLKAYGIKLRYLLYPIFIGFFCSVIAALLPSLPLSHTSSLSYPIVWEVLGGILIVTAYAVTAFISLRPAHIFDYNLISFVRAAADLLSKADDTDRVNFAEDLSYNFEKIISYTKAWERAQRNASAVEFERRSAAGMSGSFQGRPPICPFYAFAHRRELERASYSGTLLGVISDPHFCAALVRKCPWLTARTIRAISEKELHVDHAKSFVQEVAHQAILHEESIMAREIRYEGFGNVPLLSESLFGKWYILHHYNPLSGLSYEDAKNPTEGYIARLNSAAELIVKTTIKEKEYWDGRYLNSIKTAYEHLSSQLNFKRAKNQPAEFHSELHRGIEELYEATSKGLESLDLKTRKSLFIKKPDRPPSTLIQIIAEIVYNSLTSIANDFKGVQDPSWHHAIHTFQELYSSHAKEPGMNPLQQHLAIKLIEKMQDNMEGWYPAITRVLLGVIGPYKEENPGNVRTAYVILKDAIYRELQKLPELYEKKPDKVSDYLPPNVTYDHTTKALTHTYGCGTKHITALTTLNLPEINFLNEENWRLPPQ